MAKVLYTAYGTTSVSMQAYKYACALVYARNLNPMYLMHFARKYPTVRLYSLLTPKSKRLVIGNGGFGVNVLAQVYAPNAKIAWLKILAKRQHWRLPISTLYACKQAGVQFSTNPTVVI